MGYGDEVKCCCIFVWNGFSWLADAEHDVAAVYKGIAMCELRRCDSFPVPPVLTPCDSPPPSVPIPAAHLPTFLVRVVRCCRSKVRMRE